MVFFMFPSKCLPTYLYVFTYSQYLYAQKWRLGNVNKEHCVVNIKNYNGLSIFVKNENRDIAIDNWGDFCDGESSS